MRPDTQGPHAKADQALAFCCGNCVVAVLEEAVVHERLTDFARWKCSNGCCEAKIVAKFGAHTELHARICWAHRTTCLNNVPRRLVSIQRSSVARALQRTLLRLLVKVLAVVSVDVALVVVVWWLLLRS